jgi:hypothetical protein
MKTERAIAIERIAIKSAKTSRSAMTIQLAVGVILG